MGNVKKTHNRVARVGASLVSGIGSGDWGSGCLSASVFVNTQYDSAQGHNIR